MSPEVRRGRPGQETPSIKIADPNLHADLALRCAWLRVHAHRLFDVGDGLLSVQLPDVADLLEVAERQGWLP